MSSSSSSLVSTGRRRRWTWLPLLTGLLSSAVLALSMNSSLAAFTASITNDANTAGLGTLVMKETDGTTVCTSTTGTNNSVSCSINKFGGGTLRPGASATRSVTITNTGSIAADSFTLKPGECVQSGGIIGSVTDLCSKLGLTVSQTVGGTTTQLTSNGATLASLADQTITLSPALAAGASSTFTFALSVPGTLGNTYQGLTGTQNLVWTFSA